jgi:hypothetical protein
VTITFDLPTALAFAAKGDIESWLHAYLANGPRANLPLSMGLRRQQRWWRGPLRVDLDRLARCCGPEPEMEFRVNQAGWEKYTTDLAVSFTDLAAIPPLLVEYRAGLLSIRDGNHRYEAMRRKGWTSCWVILWYNSQQEYEQDAVRWTNDRDEAQV